MVAVYQHKNAAKTFVEKRGVPVWLVNSDAPDLTQRTWGLFGADAAEYWNSGAGWQRGVMPGLSIVDARERKGNERETKAL